MSIIQILFFALSAFETSADEIDWSLVYPELAGGEAKQKAKKASEFG